MTEKMTTTTKIPVTDDWARGWTDTLAAEAARTAITDMVRADADNTTACPTDADAIAADVGESFAATHAVGWEHAINAHGVTVRRYVARSQWEVDPDDPRNQGRTVRGA